MKNIRYTLTFFSFWHCGSGQSAGADVDALVVKDAAGLPYVPGRTVKGLLRDAAETLVRYGEGSAEMVEKVFGCFDGKDHAVQASAFFSDATLSEAIKSRMDALLADNFYRSVTSTEIDADGIANDKSLRKMEVVIPCTLTGTVLHLPDDCAELLEKAFQYVKRLGTGRHHGFGRCQFSMED